MEERPDDRGIARTDDQIVADVDDVELLDAIAAGRFTTQRQYRRALQRLARDECILGGIVVGTTPILLQRGERILSAAREEQSFRSGISGPDEPSVVLHDEIPRGERGGLGR